MNPKKMKVGNIPAVKLTKPGDDIDRCVIRMLRIRCILFY